MRSIHPLLRNRLAKRPVPLMFKALAAGMLASYVPGIVPLPVSISYLGWMLPLLMAGFLLLMRGALVRFPVWIWAPWVMMVAIYAVFSDTENALQRSIMLLVPVAVGAACSGIAVDDALLDRAKRWMKIFTLIFLLAAGVSVGILTQGSLADVSGFAAGSITASLLACWFVAWYAAGDTRARWWALLMVLIPVAANTRTGMVAVALALPLTLAPLKLSRRLIAVAILVGLAVLVFQSERVQQKMFFSGSGSVSEALTGLQDLISGNAGDVGDFDTSGRAAMSLALTSHLKEAYWMGHGANTTEPISLAVAGVTHPHNDWLRLRYEYGLIGTVLFALTLLAQTLHAVRQARRSPLGGALLLYAGASAFIPMVIFMLSDNVILYAAWFGNLQFAFLGLGYAYQRRQVPGTIGSPA
jgi:hypothetical protein